MDIHLTAVASHLKLCRKVLEQRLSRLESTTTKMSRHYNRLQHTRSLLSLVEEIEGVVLQDPDVWDEEPDLVPF